MTLENVCIVPYVQGSQLKACSNGSLNKFVFIPNAIAVDVSNKLASLIAIGNHYCLHPLNSVVIGDPLQHIHSPVYQTYVYQ